MAVAGSTCSKTGNRPETTAWLVQHITDLPHPDPHIYLSTQLSSPWACAVYGEAKAQTRAEGTELAVHHLMTCLLSNRHGAAANVLGTLQVDLDALLAAVATA